jgi:predicted amidohydrolase
MPAPLSIAVAQPLCVPYDVGANALAHATAVRAADTRVVVFPELSLTGYELDAPAMAIDDPRLSPLVEACADTGSTALAGAPSQGGIAMLAIDATGATVAYRKIYLSRTEAGHFTPGGKPAVLDVDGWRLGLAICKDTGVRQHAADTAALGIDVYVAGTLTSADEIYQDERARRIANQHRVWVVFASFAGSTGGGYEHAAGRSGIWAPGGKRVVQAGPETGAIAQAVLS